MSYSGPCIWIERFGTFCDPELRWKNPRKMHKLCRGQGLYRNPPPSGVGRVYYHCICKCHSKKRFTLNDQRKLERERAKYLREIPF